MVSITNIFHHVKIPKEGMLQEVIAIQSDFAQMHPRTTTGTVFIIKINYSYSFEMQKYCKLFAK